MPYMSKNFSWFCDENTSGAGPWAVATSLIYG